MKVVVCKNCGEKYQLDDSEDIDSFECSVCTGTLEELKTYPQNNGSTVDEDEEDYQEDSSSVIVYCVDCGLKFKLDRTDDINDFECISCDGSLRYVEDNLNELYGLEKISKEETEEPVHEVEIIDSEDTVEVESSKIYDDVNNISSEVVMADNSDSVDIVVGSVDSTPLDFGESVDMFASDDVEEPVHEVEILDSFYTEKPKNEFDSSNSKDLVDSVYVDSTSVDSVDMFASDDVEEPVHEVEILDSFYTASPNSNSSSRSDADIGSINPRTIGSQNNISLQSKPSSSVPRNQRYGSVSRSNSSVSVSKSLHRKPLSEEDQNKLNESKTSLIFNSPEEYEQYKIAMYKHYNYLKDAMKEEYITNLDEEIFGSRAMSRILKTDVGLHPDTVPTQEEIRNEIRLQHNVKGGKSSTVLLVSGVLLIIAGLIFYFISHNFILLILLALGIIMIVYGVYKKSSARQKEVRSKIIRDKLEELPENFYLFYFTKPPYAKSALNHVVVGPTGIYTILSQKYSSKEDKDKPRYDAENDAFIQGDSDIGNYIDKKNTLELTGGYSDHQTRFQFGNEEIQFNDNSKIKHKSLTLNEDLAIFLDKMGLSGIYIEPLIGFINNDVAIINVVLTNEDLFLDELLYRIANGPRRLDDITVMKIARLLSKYSYNCAME